MVGDVNDLEPAPPDDTGETVGLLPSSLTVTFGFGPSLFEKPGLGLGAQRPAALRPIPPLPADELNALESGGDLCVQACSDDPQVAFHAVRNLARIGRGTVAMRWSQLGFGRTSTTSRSQDTPRNLMGFKDGTANIRAEDTRGDATASSGSAGRRRRPGCAAAATWSRAGSGCCSRSGTAPRSKTRSRRSAAHKYSGAPLGRDDEFDPLDLDAERNGRPVIPVDAHVRLASAQVNGGERILRRGYSFTDGVDERLGELEAGLFFICFQRDPAKQFVAIQRRLGANPTR